MSGVCSESAHALACDSSSAGFSVLGGRGKAAMVWMLFTHRVEEQVVWGNVSGQVSEH